MKIPTALAALILSIAPFIEAEAQAEKEKENEYEQIRFIRLKNDNDIYQYWFRSDRNFTDGMAIKVSHPVFNNKPADFFLLGLKSEVKDFALSIEQDLFTPTDTQEDSIVPYDRPYAGTLFLTYEKSTGNLLNGSNITSRLHLGVVGEQAMGEPVQNGVHEAIDNPTSKGWDNQLGSGLILDYELSYQQALPINSHLHEVVGLAQVRLGSFFNAALAGVHVKFGHFGNTFMNSSGIYNKRNRNKTMLDQGDIEQLKKARKQMMPKRIRELPIEKQAEYLNKRNDRKFQFFMHVGVEVEYILYDGTLEGSLIEFSESTYSQPSSFEDPLEIIGEYGLHVQYGTFFLDFNRFLENDALHIKTYFGYGELQVGFVF